MQISKKIRAQALSALRRKDGFQALRQMFEQGTLDRQFAIKEIGRSMSEYHKFYRIEILCEAADIEKTEVRKIATDICNRLLKVGDYYLKKGDIYNASDVESMIENIICDHGLNKDDDGNVSDLMKAKIGLMLRIMEKKGNPNYPWIRELYKERGYDV